jgi:transitional endoplasmic reticulum ATPase
VVSTVPKGIVHIDANTEVELRSEYTEAKETRRADVTYDDLGGLGSTIDQLREMVELPLRYPEIFERLGVDPPKGVLLHGPARHRQDPPRPRGRERERRELLPHRRPGNHGLGLWREREEAARTVRGSRQGRALDHLHRRDRLDRAQARPGHGETEKRLVAQLLTLLDGLEPRQNLVVIAATNRPEAIDEALRRPGRFDREIVVGVPDERGRREVLGIHTRGMPLDGGVNLNELSRRTYGFVGADLAALVREAAIEAVRRIMPKINLEEGTIPPEVLETLSVLAPDFDEALQTRPTLRHARGDGAGA